MADNLIDLKQYLEQQRRGEAADTDWKDGDIDWSCFGEWQASVVRARARCSPERQRDIDAALVKLQDVASEIWCLDPRHQPSA